MMCLPGCCPQFLLDRLAAILERRAAASAKAAASGMVINTLGWVEGLGYELQLSAITSFKVLAGQAALCAGSRVCQDGHELEPLSSPVFDWVWVCLCVLCRRTLW